ncbi:MAG: AAA family ATPase [Proteobacteria bacterium]|nr:AAA family ATPase [Pseudomonadota bacterium]
MTAVPAKQAEPRPRFKLYTVEELEALPDPVWLIEGLLPEAALAELYGKPGAGKSFLALDWVLSIAAGIVWLGHSLNQADAVYVSAEGGSGLKSRFAAWRAEHSGANLDQVRFLKQPVNMLDPNDVKALIAAVRQTELDPALVVIDTLARCFGDGDENSARDMNAFVAGTDRIKTAFPQTTVLVVHHCGKNPSRGDRGSTALPGATDTVMVLTASNGGRSLTLKCEKQKDWEPFDKINLRLQVVALDDGKNSCVIAARKMQLGFSGPVGNVSDAKALDALRTFGTEGTTYTDWMTASGLKKSTFKNSLKRLLKAELMKPDKEKKRYRAADSAEGQGQGQGQMAA